MLGSPDEFNHHVIYPHAPLPVISLSLYAFAYRTAPMLVEKLGRSSLERDETKPGIPRPNWPQNDSAQR